ncbi:uncharacterized protein LOC123193193 [Mangifera indica]|uniref:uncharacterized protein LOC123193193 n=1 Tax=Mangifera indica TaxID=29780 RepID=UPI001CFBF8F2|nr:uncharacterized protein LOC123193193 [Mangifera indica]XP_044461939.1 uncharacterized protein LOC123193193 [Mangifera indica]
MENKRHESGGSSSSRNFDHLFGPKDSSSSSSSSTTSIFGSIFPPPSTMATGSYSGIMESLKKQGESSKAENSIFSSTEKNSVYQNETAEPCYLSSSIYYGGQENYSPKNKTTTESPHVFKKDMGEDDPNGNNANSASRGNWWQGSLYY